MGKLGRKGGAFPHSGAAEPHRVRQFPANLDSPGQRPPLQQTKLAHYPAVRDRNYSKLTYYLFC